MRLLFASPFALNIIRKGIYLPMKAIQEPNGIISDLIHEIPKHGKYKKSRFNLLKKISGEYILFNTLTREIVGLTDKEYDSYSKDVFSYDQNDDFIKALIEKNYIIRSSIDELKRYKEVLNIYRLISTDPKKKIQQYKIFTTTYCNARCFYCFEEGMLHNHMSIETAENVVQYILKTCVDEKITLYWFGGEPLCNISVIDYICKRLREENKDYVSKIITNGFLIDEKLIDKATKLWNLIFAQITLDGTEEEHNKRKAYLKFSESPFKLTLRNIHSLLESGVYVSARLNFDEDNIEDIKSLIEQLKNDFTGYSNFRVYPAILSNNWFNHQNGRSINTEELLHDEYFNLCNRLEQIGLYKTGKISKFPKPYFCMAANPACATISANGELYTCQSCDDKMRFGTVLEGISDHKLLNKWQNCLDIPAKCNNCPFLPECSTFDKCPTAKAHCAIDKDFTLTKQLINTLNSFSDTCFDNYLFLDE